jgi:hypothetical protein
MHIFLIRKLTLLNIAMPEIKQDVLLMAAGGHCGQVWDGNKSFSKLLAVNLLV